MLVVDKPILFSSHDVVDVVRRVMHMKRVGHAGTLDPLATGVLIMLIGESTKCFEEMLAAEKTYEGTITLGIETNTWDAEGVIQRECYEKFISTDCILEAMASVEAYKTITVPSYSSMKIHGRKGYSMARKHISFELPKKEVRIHEFKLLSYHYPDVYFRARVSSGTYIRSMAHELGRLLGVGGTLTSLRRTVSGCFNLQQSISTEHLRGMAPQSIRDLCLFNLNHYDLSKNNGLSSPNRSLNVDRYV